MAGFSVLDPLGLDALPAMKDHHVGGFPWVGALSQLVCHELPGLGCDRGALFLPVVDDGFDGFGIKQLRKFRNEILLRS